LRVNSNDANARAFEAIALAKVGRLDEALAESNSALKIDPTSKTSLYAAAVVARLRGGSDAALSWLESAVKSGYPVSDLQRDPEFQAMRDDAAFRRVLQLRN
jgi:Flp pilus assembly protein TadD